MRTPTRYTAAEVKSLSHVRLFATPWTVAHQAPLSMGFSRQEYWSGVPYAAHTHKHTCKCSHSPYTPTHVPTRSVNTRRARTHVHTHTHARTHRQHGRTPPPPTMRACRAPRTAGLMAIAASTARLACRSRTGSLLSG